MLLSQNHLSLIVKALSTFETLIMMTFAQLFGWTSSMRLKMKKGYTNSEISLKLIIKWMVQVMDVDAKQPFSHITVWLTYSYVFCIAAFHHGLYCPGNMSFDEFD